MSFDLELSISSGKRFTCVEAARTTKYIAARRVSMAAWDVSVSPCAVSAAVALGQMISSRGKDAVITNVIMDEQRRRF